MPKLVALNSVMELLSDDSDDERVSEGWFHEMESSRAYKDAVLVFLTRKFCRHRDKNEDSRNTDICIKHDNNDKIFTTISI